MADVLEENAPYNTQDIYRHSIISLNSLECITLGGTETISETDIKMRIEDQIRKTFDDLKLPPNIVITSIEVLDK